MTPSGHASPGAVEVVTIVFTILAGIFVAMCLVTRFCLLHNAGADDIFVVGGMVLSIGLSVITLLEVQFGIGRHGDTLTEHEDTKAMKLLYASIAVYAPAMFCTKFSILIQYLRIFPQVGFRRACYTLMFVVFSYASWCFWSGIFFCKPISAFWKGGIQDGQCLDLQIVWFFNSAGNIASDIAVAVLPLPVLRHLQFPKRAKNALMAIFALGGFTCIVSILRLEAIYAVSVSKDQTWENSLAAVWSVVEINTSIVCSSLPTLKAFTTRVFPGLFTSTRASYYTGLGTGAGSKRYGATNVSKHSVGMSHDALGRGLTGLAKPMQQSYAGRATSLDKDGLELFGVKRPAGAIQVTTVVNQEVEKDADDYGRRSDHGSTRELMR